MLLTLLISFATLLKTIACIGPSYAMFCTSASNPTLYSVRIGLREACTSYFPIFFNYYLVYIIVPKWLYTSIDP